MYTNTVEPDRPQNDGMRMGISCWRPRATDPHSEEVILIAFPMQHCTCIMRRLSELLISFHMPKMKAQFRQPYGSLTILTHSVSVWSHQTCVPELQQKKCIYIYITSRVAVKRATFFQSSRQFVTVKNNYDSCSGETTRLSSWNRVVTG